MKNNKIKSKGQAALEFMMTYGWALLLLTALVAGLVYVMPHPKGVVANKCVFGSAVPCMGVRLSEANLTLSLRNGLGNSIYNISANMTMPFDRGCAVSNVTARAEEMIFVTCSSSGITDDSRIRVELRYKKVKDGYDQIIVGEIYAKHNE